MVEKQLDRRRFSGAVEPDEGEYFPFKNVQVEAGYSLNRTS